ncbi:MAG TPA: fatty acid desaturase [Bryobacteraceae bacterium]|nr:fatty acid desaturase [Bryobacteraceae bacterium]
MSSGALLLRGALQEQHALNIDDVQVRALVRDLHRVSASVYWSDLLASSIVGWGAFVFGVVLPPFSAGMVAAALIAIFALYRALCFIHEISHQNRRTLPGFETVWNFLAGYPLMMPSFIYVGVHQDHHKLSSYGTSSDPEYLPFARSSGRTTAFALESFFIPVLLLVRFLVFTPLGLISKRLQQWLIVHASSLTINIRYRRDVTPNLVKTIRRDSIFIVLLWAVPIALAALGVIPWRTFLVWFVVVSVASFINTLRTLGAHAYESSGEPLDRMGQLIDSIDTPGRSWTELWAPVGLRYHALHHYFPGIPYHSLPEAYRRLVGTLPLAAEYRKMSSRSLPHSLSKLLKKGMRRSGPHA